MTEKEKFCIADTRNKIDNFAVCEIKKYGYRVERMTLPFGDFALLDNLTCAVDIKSSGGGITELAKNVCSFDHERLRREILKCASWNGKICFLIANNDGITKIEQLINWKSKYTKIKGITLLKALNTMSEPNHYKNGLTVKFSFCDKKNAGKKIVQILEFWKTN